MATPLTFSKFTGWVDVADENNPPAGARPIMAGDLVRYENFMDSAKTRINEHDTIIVGWQADGGFIAANTKDAVGGVAALNASRKVDVSRMSADNTSGLRASLPAWNATLHPLGFIYFCTDTQEVIRSTGSAWATILQPFRHMEFTNAGTSIVANTQSSPGTLAVDSARGAGAAFATTSTTSGALTINETGWYDCTILQVPNGSPGGSWSTAKIGSSLICSGMTTGLVWELAPSSTGNYITAGSLIQLTLFNTSSRTWTTRVNLDKKR